MSICSSGMPYWLLLSEWRIRFVSEINLGLELYPKKNLISYRKKKNLKLIIDYKYYNILYLTAKE